MRFPWQKKTVQTDAAPEVHEDVWSNPATRFGVYGKDKTLGTYFSAELIDQESALEIWRGDDLGGRLVELPPQEMTREGWDVLIEEDKEASEAVDAAGRDHDVNHLFYLGECYGRALGGGGALMLVDDGVEDLGVPMREDRIRSFLGVNLLTPRELLPVRWYSDPREPMYGQVALYRLIPVNAPPGTVVTDFPLVHESRIIRFSGTVTTPAARFRGAVHLGWDDSIFARVRKPLMDFQNVMQGANILAQDFAPAVFKALELAKLLAAAKSQSRDISLADRLSAMEFGSSNAKVKVIDAKEDYKRESVSVAGLPELLERFMLRLSAAAGMPVSLLMGQAPSGLNATGDSDIRWFYDHVASHQEKRLKPALKRFYKVLMLAKDGPTGGKLPDRWDIAFRPLWQMTPAEQAKMRLDVANADNLYIGNGTLYAEEVARERFTSAWTMETRIDLAEREKLAHAQAELEATAQAAGREADPEGPEASAAKAASKAANAPPATPKPAGEK